MIAFAKMHGNGNDFVVFENLDRAFGTEDLSRLAIALCDRKKGLGGDGILVAEPSAKAPLAMRIFNRDGSEGEMCGNGARCFARMLHRLGLEGPESRFLTGSGTVSARV